jgi:hypothetical protein
MSGEASEELNAILRSVGGFESREVAEECLREIQAIDTQLADWRAEMRRRDRDVRARLAEFKSKWNPYQSSSGSGLPDDAFKG